MPGSQNDDHPNIIKMPDEEPTSQYGVGYELFQNMKRHSEKIAQYIVETSESQTYAELLEECIKVAINLRAENLSSDDVVGLCMDNHKDVCVPYAACLFLGIKVIPMSNGYVIPEERCDLLKRVKPKIIFVDENVLEIFQNVVKITNLNIKLVVLGENSVGETSYSDFLVASKEDVDKFEPIKLESNRGTAVLFSGSGTSGKVKAVCLSHHTLLTRIGGESLPLSIVLTRMYWISHFLGTFSLLNTGSTRVAMKETTEMNVWKAIEKYKIICLMGSVYQLNNLTKCTDLKDVDVSSLKFVVGGGIAFPVSTIRALRTIIPRIVILPAYGLTEIGGVALTFNLQNAQHRQWSMQKPTSCGTPIEGIWYKVVDPETEKIVGPNELGELRLKSNLLMVEYYNMDSSDVYDAAGWFKTGDIFKYDEDNCFFMIERMKEMIRTERADIVPTKLEHLLMEHPMVHNAAVIGIPQSGGYEIPMGIVTLNRNCIIDPKELEDFVNSKVNPLHRLNGGVKIIQEMPMTGNGKLQKRTLREMYQNGEL
ncbi:hypothetical protein WA026_023324 [Henosepilachna vigintioctopunctata]|uniref:Luciferin 4-monooxygenase n=1 Tax=Henosepilachna vigintioctopunctata TaxID=420089 RepID=A0AAW1UQL5_9CUCU